MYKRLFAAIVLLALVGGGLVGFNIMRDKGIKQYFANRTPPPVTVSTQEVKAVTWTPVIDAIGTVLSVRGVELTVEASGIIHEIGFTANQTVKQGDVLLRLDDAVEQADLEAARAQADLDQQSLDRQMELANRGVATNVSLDSAQATAAASKAQVSKLEAVVEQKRLRAPFDGTIGIPNVDLGQFVTPGTNVATLQDLTTLLVDFTVPEQKFNLLNIGQRVILGPEDGSLDIRATVTGIDPKVNPQTRLASVRAEVNDPTGTVAKRLTPGQFVRVNVLLPQEDGVIAVPQTAVVTSLYGDHVFAVRPVEGADGKQEARQVFVTVGRRSGDIAEIVKGLEPGDIVVTAGQNRLSNGATVTVDNSVTPGDGTLSAPATEARK
ncbi:MAG: efflux RND transporter periplasmic adaptor subunit [Paracoccaceae bacterium]